MNQHPSIWQEFQTSLRTAPRVWFIVLITFAVVLALGRSFELIAVILLVLLTVFGVLCVLPAVMGAFLGSATGGLVRWFKRRLHK